MGRKKKEIKITDSSNIKYQGTVTVQTIKKGKVTSTSVMHNEGRPELFKFLLLCLAASYQDSLRPFYVIAANNDKLLGTLPMQISSVKAFVENTQTPYIEYKFFMPFMNDYLDGFNQLALYSKSKMSSTGHEKDTPITDASMVVTAKASKPFKPALDEDLLITWQLKILNPVQSNS